MRLHYKHYMLYMTKSPFRLTGKFPFVNQENILIDYYQALES